MERNLYQGLFSLIGLLVVTVCTMMLFTVHKLDNRWLKEIKTLIKQSAYLLFIALLVWKCITANKSRNCLWLVRTYMSFYPKTKSPSSLRWIWSYKSGSMIITSIWPDFNNQHLCCLILAILKGPLIQQGFNLHIICNGCTCQSTTIPSKACIQYILLYIIRDFIYHNTICS